MKAAEKILEVLEENITDSVLLLVRLKKAMTAKPKRRVIYLKLIKKKEEEAETTNGDIL